MQKLNKNIFSRMQHGLKGRRKGQNWLNIQSIESGRTFVFGVCQGGRKGCEFSLLIKVPGGFELVDIGALSETE
jgi:hypothetical protein